MVRWAEAERLQRTEPYLLHQEVVRGDRSWRIQILAEKQHSYSGDHQEGKQVLVAAGFQGGQNQCQVWEGRGEGRSSGRHHEHDEEDVRVGWWEHEAHHCWGMDQGQRQEGTRGGSWLQGQVWLPQQEMIAHTCLYRTLPLSDHLSHLEYLTYYYEINWGIFTKTFHQKKISCPTLNTNRAQITHITPFWQYHAAIRKININVCSGLRSCQAICFKLLLRSEAFQENLRWWWRWSFWVLVSFHYVGSCNGDHRDSTPACESWNKAWSYTKCWYSRCSAAPKVRAQTGISSHRDKNPVWRSSCKASSWPWNGPGHILVGGWGWV